METESNKGKLNFIKIDVDWNAFRKTRNFLKIAKPLNESRHLKRVIHNVSLPHVYRDIYFP